jgi:nucleoid DNA-binding protein
MAEIWQEGEIHMNKADVIRKVSEETGIESNVCEKVIKAFEEQAGGVLAGKLKGEETDQGNIPASISERTGISENDCEKVLTALETVVRDGISDKLNIFKRMFSRQ